MHRSKLIVAFVLGSLVSFSWYFIALADWVQDFKTGIYHQNYIELALETGAILLYNLAGIFFLRRKTNLL